MTVGAGPLRSGPGPDVGGVLGGGVRDRDVRGWGDGGWRGDRGGGGIWREILSKW